MNNHNIKFYCAWYCPFAQRTWLTMEHLGIDYEYIEIDPYEKSDHWFEVSRGAETVPVLVVEGPNGQDIHIPESLRTMEYLQDINNSDYALFPIDTALRAEARFWLDYQGNKIVPYFYRALQAKHNSDDAKQSQQAMVAGLEGFAKAMHATGPYFFGKEIGVVDLALIPFALRIDILLSHYKDFHLPSSGIWARYLEWYDATKNHPSFIKTISHGDQYSDKLIEAYKEYSLGGGQTDVTQVD